MRIPIQTILVVSLCALSAVAGRDLLAQPIPAGIASAATERYSSSKHQPDRLGIKPATYASLEADSRFASNPPLDFGTMAVGGEPFAPVLQATYLQPVVPRLDLGYMDPRLAGLPSINRQVLKFDGEKLDGFPAMGSASFGHRSDNHSQPETPGSDRSRTKNGLAAIFRSILSEDKRKIEPRNSDAAVKPDLGQDSPIPPGSSDPPAAAAVEAVNGPTAVLGDSQKIQLDATLRRIGTGSLITLIAATALIFLLKRFGSAIPHKRHKSSELQIIETYRLTAKSHLKLIEVGKSRFLIAVNADGIKSIQSVHPSFETAFAAFNANADEIAESPSGEQSTVQHGLPANLEAHRAPREFASGNFGARRTSFH